MLANPVVEILADTTLLAFADFEELLLKVAALGHFMLEVRICRLELSGTLPDALFKFIVQKANLCFHPFAPGDVPHHQCEPSFALCLDLRDRGFNRELFASGAQ